jgi:protoporphyrinogen oxidase
VERTVETIDTLIIGAGPAGLTTAYRLAKAGHGLVVIEQDKHYVGGNQPDRLLQGFPIRYRRPSVLFKVARGGGALERDLPGPRLSRIYYAGKFYAYPLKAFEALRNLGLVQPKHK